MTSVTDVCNLMLQRIGTRTTVTDAEIAGNSTNEAIQFNLMYTRLRDRLLRMAPWNCAMRVANLTYITSQPGTPENTSPATPLWTPGQPAPPWAYEYQYPVDCLSARWIIPSTQTGYAGGVPVTTAVTGGASSWWWGQPVRFKVQTDDFFPVTAAAVAAGGTGHAVGDVITLPSGPNTLPPIGAPAQLLVTSVGLGGVITGVSVVSVVAGTPASAPVGGSYFAPQANPVAQGTTTGAGTGASFNLTFGPQAPQRVILTNQEFATLAYTRQVADPNVWDPAFQEAMFAIGGATLCMALQGSKDLANSLVQGANEAIRIARGDDGNEGLTVNDVTPDWIRFRGVAYTDGFSDASGPYQGYDWGSYFPMF